VITIFMPCSGSKWSPGPAHRTRTRERPDTRLYGPYLKRLLTAREERTLAEKIKRGDRNARETLILANLALAAYVAKRYRCSGATMEDLLQEGVRGVIRAAKDYDPQLHNTRFSSYATYWVRNMIQRAVSANCCLIRVPDYMFRVRHRFERSASRHGRAPVAEDAADANISREQYQNILCSMIERSPFTKEDTEGDHSSLVEAPTDEHRAEQEAERAEEAEQLYRALERLTPMEAWVVRQRFGLANGTDLQGVASSDDSADRPARRQRMSYREVGKAYKISPLHARKIEQHALAKLRAYLGPGLDPGGD
jgi:RNA polymerase primary sigma factor